MSSLNPVLTIGSQITESISAHMHLSRQETNDLAVKLLGMVGIPEARDRLKSYPHQFSGGQRQRIMIAIAIACNPALLIADEPTTALDVTIQAQITELVKSLHDQIGMSLIWITHDLGVIAGLVDRVLVMYAGFLVEDAPVDNFYDRPLHPYAEGLLKSIPRMDAEVAEKLDSIEGLPPNLTEMPAECVFLKRCPYAQEICHQQMPPIFELAPQHMAACWIDISNNTVREDMVSQFRQ